MVSTPPIKTGAWVFDEQRREYFRCDLYEYVNKVLIARINPQSATRHPPMDEGLWATMHEVDNEFIGHDKDIHTLTYVSTNYSVHYMLQFSNGAWHDVKLA